MNKSIISPELTEKQLRRREAERLRKKRAYWAHHSPEQLKKNCEKSKKWRTNNPKRAAEFVKKTRAKNPEKYRNIVYEWRKKNSEDYKALHISVEARRRSRARSSKGSHTGKQILDLYKRQKGKCAEISCKKPLNGKYHADHVMPLALGGSNDIKNIQLLCPKCNQLKGATHPIEWAQSKNRLL